MRAKLKKLALFQATSTLAKTKSTNVKMKSRENVKLAINCNKIKFPKKNGKKKNKKV